jgi:MinD superfamily P-loop ATPase
MPAKELVVMSGKGGTGKTTVVASFAAMAHEPVLADCDVDAPDLHLVLGPEVVSTEEYQGTKLARMDAELCTECGLCVEACRYDTISEDLVLDETACEGCGTCAAVCPVGAIVMEDRVTGELFTSETRFGPMAHAHLRAGEEASGKLVMQVRGLATDLALGSGRELILIDGPPGIGCPAISALSGADAVLAVTEPTLSGRQGLQRMVELAEHFEIPTFAVVNKADLNPEEATAIEGWCRGRRVEVLGRLPYDGASTKAMIAGRAVVEHGDGPLAVALRELWEDLLERLAEC